MCTELNLDGFHHKQMVNVWNSLPCDIVNFTTVSAFKRSVQKLDLSEFCSVI